MFVHKAFQSVELQFRQMLKCNICMHPAGQAVHLSMAAFISRESFLHFAGAHISSSAQLNGDVAPFIIKARAMS